MVDEGNLVRASDAGIVMITEIKPIAVIFTLPQQQLAQINAAQARGTRDGRGARRRRQDRPRSRHAAGRRQPGRPDHRHRAHEGGVPQRQPAAVAGPVRQRARPRRDLEPGRGHSRRPAVQRGPNGTFAYVVQADQRVGLRPITVGLQTETTAVITKGIAASERVVTTGFSRLKDGARVAVVRAEDQPAGAAPRGQGRRSAATPSRKRARRCARPAPRTCRSSAPRSSAAGTPSAPACRRTPPSFRRPARPPARQRAEGRQGARGRRAQARGKLAAMSVSTPFIRRPIATSLLGFAVTLGGALGYWWLPVSSLPQVDFPTIQVTTQLPGANPDTTANLVTAPLERQLGQIPALATMTSTSSYGISQITLQFVLNRDIDAAAQDVQSAINAAGSTLPRNLPYPADLRQGEPGRCGRSSRWR